MKTILTAFLLFFSILAYAEGPKLEILSPKKTVQITPEGIVFIYWKCTPTHARLALYPISNISISFDQGRSKTTLAKNVSNDITHEVGVFAVPVPVSFSGKKFQIFVSCQDEYGIETTKISPSFVVLVP